MRSPGTDENRTSDPAVTVDLAVLEQGEGNGAPLVILHGLFGSARNWQSIARTFAEKRQVLAFDLRNHGNSPWAPTMSYGEMAQDVWVALSVRGISDYVLLGHSMGGKVAMTMALERPHSVERLVVVDIAPTAHAPVHQQLIEAMLALDLSDTPRRSDAEARLATAVPEVGLRQFLVQNLVSEDGGLRWRINLQAINSSLAELSSFPPLDPAKHYEGPTLIVAGERSTYIKSEDRPVFRRIFPHSQIVEIANAGHWVHAEQPLAFVEAVTSFLECKPFSV